MEILAAMSKLFLTLGLGILLRKTDFLDEDANKRFSALIVNITLPLLVVASVTGLHNDIEGGQMEIVKIVLLGIVCYVLYPAIGWLLVKLMRVPPHLQGTYVCMAVFSNNAFMGFPIVSALFGDMAIFYTNIFHLAFNLVFFTVGVRWIRKDAGEIEDKKAKAAMTPAEKRLAWRKVFNNGIIAAVLALVIFFVHIPVPSVISETLKFVGNMSMPMSMLVIGSSMAGYSLKELIPKKEMVVMTLVRLALMPFLTYLILSPFLHQTVAKILAITVGMPIASLVSMGTAPYEEQGKHAAVAVVFSTLCSVVSIPLMCAVIGT